MDIYKALKNLTIANPDIITLIQQEPSLIGVDTEYFTPFTLMFIVYLGTYLFIVITYLSFVYIIYFLRSLKIKETLSELTRKTFNMLFRVLNIQMLVLGITFLLPGFAVYSVQLLQLKHISQFTIIILVPFSFHHTIDFLCQMYFVIPFRRFIVKKVKEVKKYLYNVRHFRISASI
jgi:hypothetical protein